MRFGSLVHLYRIRLRSRLVTELLAVAGIAIGVALVFAALIAGTSLTGSVRQLTEGLVGDASFQLASRSPEGFDQRVFHRVEAIDGARSAAPIVEARGNLVGPKGLRSVLLVGGDPRFARFGGPLLQQVVTAKRDAAPGLVLPAPLAADLGVEPGDEVRVETGAGVAPVRVVGLLRREDIGSLAESPVALGPLPLVQQLSGMAGRISRIFVSPRAGRDRRVELALDRIAADRLNVGPADDEVSVFERAAYPTNRSTDLFSALSALVGFLFALSAMLLTVPQRRRLIADLRLAGYQPWVIVELLLLDALVLGVVGSALGLMLGDQVSRHLFGTVPDYLTSAFAVGTQRIVTLQTIAVAGAAGIAAGCLAVLAPVREALSANPKRPSGVASASGREATLILAGVALLAIAAVVVAFEPRLGLVGIGSLTLALLLLLPVLLGVASSGFERLVRRTKSSTPILAALELRSGAAQIRTLALAATGAIAVFATVSIGGAHADLQRGLDAAVRDTNRGADIWVTFRGTANVFSSTRFALSSERFEEIEGLPGVRSVRRHGGGLLDVGDFRVWVIAPPSAFERPVPPSQIRKGDVSRVNSRVHEGGWVVLSTGVADELEVDVGDEVVLPSPVPIELRVAGLSTNNGWPGGAIVMNGDDYVRAWGSKAAGAIGVRLLPNASPDRVAHSIERLLGPRVPLRVATRAETIESQFGASRRGLARLSQISAIVLISAVLAMATAMGGMIWQRRPTLAALKVHGFGELKLWRSLLLESGLLLGTGCLIGAVFGLFCQVLLSRALEAITGFPVIYALAAPLAIVTLALVTFIALAVLAIPGLLAVRVRPVAGLPD